MKLAWVMLLFVSLAGVVNAQEQCYECLTLVQGQEQVAQLNLPESGVRTALSSGIADNPFFALGNCTAANYGGTTTCSAASTGCATESFTLNMNHPTTGNFVVEAERRYCSGQQQGCLSGPEYVQISSFANQLTLNFALQLVSPNLTYVGLDDGSVCTCSGSLCNGATGRETSYVVLLAALLLAVSAKYVY